MLDKQKILYRIDNAQISDQEMEQLINGFYKINDNGTRIYQDHPTIVFDEEISLAIYKHRKKLKETNLRYFGYGLKSLISYYIILYAAIIALHGLMIYGIVACWKAFYTSTGYSACGYSILGTFLVILTLGYFTMYVEPVNYAEEDKTLKNCVNNEKYYKAIRDKYNYQIIRGKILENANNNTYIQNIIKKNHKNSKGNTLLHMAVINDDYSFITILLANGADPSIKNKDGLNPLSLAINDNRKQAFDSILDIYIAKITLRLLIDHKGLNNDVARIVESYKTGIDEKYNLSPIENSQQDKYLEAIGDVMHDTKENYYKEKLIGTHSLKELLLSAIENNNDQLAAKLCKSFYTLDDNGIINHTDKKISLAIYKKRKKLKKTNFEYFGFGLKTLINYYYISYAAIIALIGLMIYGAVASFKEYLSYSNSNDTRTANNFLFLALLLLVMALCISALFTADDDAHDGFDKTIRNWKLNKQYYKSIVGMAQEGPSNTNLPPSP